MKVLFIGGTGNISLSCTIEAAARGIEVVHFNRGKKAGEQPLRAPVPEGVRTITGDIRNTDEANRLLGHERFDCVVDWICYTPDQIEQDIELFQDRTDQFIFISSASVYHKPPRHYLITESTPAFNPFWQYSQKKIASENRLWQEYRSAGFPATVVRPSHTYSDSWFPTTFHTNGFTVPQRILDGKPIVVHGDGQSLWTITHADDFARGFTGLLGNPRALGETFHITSEEALTWDQIHLTIGQALGREPKIIHATSEMIARLGPEHGPSLLGDKQYSLVFDNSKIRSAVPDYVATIRFFEGMRRSVAWYEAHPEQKTVDAEIDKLIDDIIAAVEPHIR